MAATKTKVLERNLNSPFILTLQFLTWETLLEYLQTCLLNLLKSLEFPLRKRLKTMKMEKLLETLSSNIMRIYLQQRRTSIILKKLLLPLKMANSQQRHELSLKTGSTLLVKTGLWKRKIQLHSSGLVLMIIAQSMTRELSIFSETMIMIMTAASREKSLLSFTELLQWRSLMLLDQI